MKSHIYTKSVLITLFFVTIPVFTVFSQSNLIKNGGFELGTEEDVPKNWSLELADGVTASVTDNNPEPDTEGGSYSLFIDGIDDGGDAIQFVEIESGATYRFSYLYNYTEELALPEDGDGFYHFLTWYDKDMNKLGYLNDDKDLMRPEFSPLVYSEDLIGIWFPFEWEEDVVITAPENAAKLKVNIQAFFASGAIDNVTLEKIGGSVGIDENEETSLKVYKEGTSLKVETKVGETVSIYNISGVLVQQIKSDSNNVSFEGLPQNQMLIVCSGNRTAKVIM